MASVGIVLFLLLVLVQVLWAAFDRLRFPAAPTVNALSFVVMGLTVLVNVGVVSYERRAGRRLASEVLLADSHHTQSDLLTSLTVIAALVGVSYGMPLLDPMAAIIVAGFIGHACWDIFRDTSRILLDQIVIAEDNIRRVVSEVPEDPRLPPHPLTRLDRSRVPRSAHLDGRRHAPRRGASSIACGERQNRGALSTGERRGHPHRAAALEQDALAARAAGPDHDSSHAGDVTLVS